MQPRISYVDPATIKDQAMLDELDRWRREGTPQPESQAIRAHVPAAFWSFANTWRDVFHRGVVDHNIKELCRVYVSHSVLCEFCGNQRSMKSAKAGLIEDDYGDLSNVELSTRYDDKQKAALGYFIAITMGQQRWLRTLNIEHHQILAETDASMAPGFETLDALAKSKSDPNYWAKKNAKPNSSAA